MVVVVNWLRVGLVYEIGYEKGRSWSDGYGAALIPFAMASCVLNFDEGRAPEHMELGQTRLWFSLTTNGFAVGSTQQEAATLDFTSGNQGPSLVHHYKACCDTRFTDRHYTLDSLLLKLRPGS